MDDLLVGKHKEKSGAPVIDIRQWQPRIERKFTGYQIVILMERVLATTRHHVLVDIVIPDTKQQVGRWHHQIDITEVSVRIVAKATSPKHGE